MIEIREARGSDECEIFDLSVRLATSYQPQAGAFSMLFEGVLSRDTEASLLAESNGCLVGYCLGSIHSAIYSHRPISWLEELFVVEGVRGAGVGSWLVDAFEQWSAQKGCVLVTLATRRAGDFYLKRGYERSAECYRKPLTDR